MGKEIIQVALVEDDPGMQERLLAALKSNASLNVCYQAATGFEMMAWLKQKKIAEQLDVLLVDLGLPDCSGIEVIEFAAQCAPKAETMVITMFGDESNMIRAFEAGAKGYLLKDATGEDLVQHVFNLHAGGSPMSPIIARQLLTRLRPANLKNEAVSRSNAEKTTSASIPTATLEKLTPRETEILSLLSRGYTYPELARLLGLSVSTIQSHIKHIYGKLAVHSKTEAVFEARQMGLLAH